MRIKSHMWWVGALMLASFACGKKSAADLEKDWHAAEENAQKYATKYPAAKGVLDDLTAKAKANFEEAKKAPEDQRVDKMHVAVDRVAGSVTIFTAYEGEVTKIDTLLHDKDLMNMSAADFRPLEKAANSAKKKACCIIQPKEKMCSDIEGTCETVAPPANMGELKAKLEVAIKEMETASKALEAKKPKPATPPAGSGSGSAKK